MKTKNEIQQRIDELAERKTQRERDERYEAVFQISQMIEALEWVLE